MDYLRKVGGSKEAAKELKLFELEQFPHRTLHAVSPTRSMKRTSLCNRASSGWGACSRFSARLGYYGAYVYVIYRTVTGALTLGSTDLYHHRHHAGQ